MTFHIDKEPTMFVRRGPWASAFSVAVVLLLGASIGHAQRGGPQTSSDVAGLVPGNSNGIQQGSSVGMVMPTGARYVACWAEAAEGATFVSATFESHTPWKARKEFRELVETRYGPVAQARCAGNSSPDKIQELVRRWKDDARAASNPIVETGWQL